MKMPKYLAVAIAAVLLGAASGARADAQRESMEELRNTVINLLQALVDQGVMTKEKASEHIDTIGQALVTSGFLLDQYFQSANRLVETRLGRPELPPQAWHFTGHFVQYEELQGPHKAAFNFKYLCLYEQPNTDTRQGGYGHIEDFLKGVPVSGLYDIAVHAQAEEDAAQAGGLLNRIAGRAWLFVHDGAFHAEESVEKTGFASVRKSGNGHTNAFAKDAAVVGGIQKSRRARHGGGDFFSERHWQRPATGSTRTLV